MKACKIKANAIANNETTFKGNPCKRKHNGTRYTNSNQCVTCARINGKKASAIFRQTESGKAYNKEYQAKYRSDPKNKERINKIRFAYYIKKNYNNDLEFYKQFQLIKATKKAKIDEYKAAVALRKKLRDLRNSKG